jgi:chemosensory pili system protein ChpA (sensor histidine kinase/response regulator)
MVRAGGHVYAVPSVMVEHVQELKTDALNAAYQNRKVELIGNDYPFVYLPRLLGDLDHVPEVKTYNRILLLRSGAARLAMHVDELIGIREVVVKNIGPQLARVPGMEGATVMGDGHIIFIINPVKLMLHDEAQAPVSAAPVVAAPTALAPLAVPTVMVVDDSLTVRKITSRLLSREGYEVLTAKDGLDAWQQLQEVIPDVMLVDIEMPRMDGFELTRNVRGDSRTKEIPIIIISSRTADKHRNVANELGVNVFLGKPYQEDELLKHIAEFIKR